MVTSGEGHQYSETSSTASSPFSQIEDRLCQVWSEILNIPSVTINDDFFALGGDSIDAVALAARILDEMYVELPSHTIIFENPTVAELARVIERSQIQMRFQRIQPIPRTDGMPLSFAQQRLWFLEQLHPGTSAYHIRMTLNLTGHLERHALEQSFQAVIRRHEALRTIFIEDGGNILQKVSDKSAFSLQFIDLQGVPEENRLQEGRTYLADHSSAPFDLSGGPLFRALLLQCEPEAFVLGLTFHHLIADAHSKSIFLSELFALYESFAQRKSVSLPEIPIHYIDFAVWQRDRWKDENLKEDISYWKQQLEGVSGLLALPTDKPRLAVESNRGSMYQFTLASSLCEALRMCAQQEGATLFQTLLATWQILLARCSGQETVVVGTPVSNRTRRELENVIGVFVNTMPLCADISGNPSFQAFLQQVRTMCLAAFSHQELPFERLVELLQPERSLSHTPLFQTMFIWQQEVSTLGLSDLRVQVKRGESQSAMYDLTLFVEDGVQGFECSLEYNSDLFEQSTISRIATQWQLLLEDIVIHPGRRLNEISFLSDDQRHLILEEWNATQRAYALTTIHEAFTRQVERTPNAAALINGQQRNTFAQINRQANQLAYYLQKSGVGPATRVGICLPRSFELFVCVLAVLKTGAAYVPLDPSYPQERLSFMLLDSESTVLLTQSTAIPDFSASIRCSIVLVDREAERIALEATTNPITSISPAGAAYVIYTSGSTGTPKGVIGTHQGVTNRCTWMWETYPFIAGEVCCQKTAFSFVDSVWEMFGPLLQGVPIVILPVEEARDPYRLVQCLVTYQVTRIVLVPSLLRVLLECHPSIAQRLPFLRYWICSGEALPVDLFQQFRRRLPDRLLLNLYGSSEVAADATYYDTSALPYNCFCVPIGRPIANMRVYLLDERLQPIPLGVIGEICIAGIGLAHGYWQRPELTAERFIPDPFHKQSGSRLFRSGDYGRYLSDGTIEYVGRRDQQVKLRGYRIELDEIERTLLQHAKVQQVCITIAARKEIHNRILIAYIVATSYEDISQEELRCWLQERLPDYMIPAVFIWMHTFPLTPNGKIDRKALPPPEEDHLQQDKTYTAPRTSEEHLLVSIWKQVLNLKQVGVRDDFFALGGHSLLAMRVVAAIQEKYGREISLAALFQYKTIESLVASMHHAPVLQTSSLISIQQGNQNVPAFYCIHPIGGNVLCYIPLTHALGETQPVYGVEAYGIHEGETAHSSIEEMATYYLDVLQNHQAQSPYRLAGWSFGGIVAFEMAQQLQQKGAHVELLVLVDSCFPQFVYDRSIDIQLTASFVKSFVHNLNTHLSQPLLLDEEKLIYMSADDQLQYLLHTGIAAQALPSQMKVSQLRHYLHVFQTHTRALNTYTPEKYTGRCIYFLAVDSNVPTNTPNVERWKSVGTEQMDIRAIPATHFTIMQEPYAQMIAKQISLELRKV